MKFTELLKEIQATYPEQPRSFHVIATRYYIGSETLESLRSLATSATSRPILTEKQVQAIIDNR